MPDNGPNVPEHVAYTKIYNCVRSHLTECFQQDCATFRDFLNLFVIYHALVFPVLLKIILSQHYITFNYKSYHLSIATDWTVRGSNPGRGARFSSPLQNGHGAQQASYTMGTASSPGEKRPGRGADHPPHLAPKLKKEQNYTSTSPLEFHSLLYGELHLYLSS